MNEQMLKTLYAKDNVAKAFFDHMAARKRNQAETKVDRVLVVLANEGLSRGDVVELFKGLEEVGCGQFVIGRRGWPSRFVWSVSSLAASHLATGEVALMEDVTADSAEESEEADEFLSHTFNLRPDLPITLDLPADLSVKEAERLALFVRSLPMEEFE
ncbi:MAG: hypothetical protein QOH06_1067 [Acidobacteriota bacterium]|jgi:hypothetical protein|nr:hypothetical protein [Acidobacteriota bacterium]